MATEEIPNLSFNGHLTDWQALVYAPPTRRKHDVPGSCHQPDLLPGFRRNDPVFPLWKSHRNEVRIEGGSYKPQHCSRLLPTYCYGAEVVLDLLHGDFSTRQPTRCAN
jgi:hypothetical protein